MPIILCMRKAPVPGDSEIGSYPSIYVWPNHGRNYSERRQLSHGGLVICWLGRELERLPRLYSPKQFLDIIAAFKQRNGSLNRQVAPRIPTIRAREYGP